MTDNLVDLISNSLFNKCDKWIEEDVAYFSDVTGESITPLVFEGILDPRRKCSSCFCPNISDILEFLNNHTNFTCHGCVTIDDGCVYIKVQGLYCSDFSDKDKEDFITFSMTSDVQRITQAFLYCRWN